MATVIETTLGTIEDIKGRQATSGLPSAKREYALAITAAEDLIMRFNRGIAIDHGILDVGDVEAFVTERKLKQVKPKPEGDDADA